MSASWGGKELDGLEKKKKKKKRGRKQRGGRKIDEKAWTLCMFQHRVEEEVKDRKEKGCFVKGKKSGKGGGSVRQNGKSPFVKGREKERGL